MAEPATSRTIFLIAVPIAVAVVLGTLGTFLFGFGLKTQCTNEFSCTVDSCPSVCDRVDLAVWVNLAGQLALAVALAAAAVVGTRKERSRPVALAIAGLVASVALFVVSAAFAASWSSA